MLIQVTGAMVALVQVCAIVLLLRTLNSRRIPNGTTFDSADLCHRPMQRLLDQAEVQYLRDNGISKGKITKLRSKRRRIYRLYLRTLAQEFNRVHDALKSLLISSYSDQPDLATLLAKQTFIFYRNLLLVE